MQILSDIPSELDATAMMRRVHLEPGSEDATDFEALVDTARERARPKALYDEALVERGDGDTVLIGGVTFTSRMLHANLESIERVFPYVATCGREADEAAPAGGDLLKDFWWDTIKAHLLGAATRHLNDRLETRFRLGKTAGMSPGSGDVNIWPIEQQRPLFSLLGDVEAQIGVTLTDSFLMVPNKTVSGIRFPTEKDFRTCQVCHREPCPSRSAPFDKELWDTLQHD